MKQKKKKMGNLDKALLLMASFFLFFTAAVLFIFWQTGGSEPTVLVGGVCAAVLGEIVACTRIKIGKQRDKYHDKYEGNNNGNS